MPDRMNPPGLLGTIIKDECIKMYDLLRGLSPRHWRFLRDYPSHRAGHAPAAVTQLFLDAGMLTNAVPPPQLTRLGQIAQGEIARAEQYIASRITCNGELGADVRAGY